MANVTPAAAGHESMDEMDYAEHERNYHSFLKLAKWVIISIVTLLILMTYFLL